MNIEIMNLRNEKPSQPYDFYIDRRTPVGNPFQMNKESDREMVCDKYVGWFNKQQEDWLVVRYLERLERVYKKYDKLRLFCWCVPKECHGYTIKNFLINKIEIDRFEKGE